VVVRHSRSNLELTRYDLSTMRPGEWLNDECMNMYMALLQVRVHVQRCSWVGLQVP
jgi:Ulp1 family protease